MAQSAESFPCPVTADDVTITSSNKSNFDTNIVTYFSITCPLKQKCRYLGEGEVSGWRRGQDIPQDNQQANIAEATNDRCNAL